MKTSAARKPINREDRGLTIVGLVLLAPALGALAWYAVVVLFVGDRCNPPVTECNREIILAGHYIARFGTIAVGIVALVTSIALLRARRRAAWVPPLALGLALCVFMGGGEFAKLGAQP
ncbi:hypothetical protein [Agromyces mariniharenae]|uniref:Uncharacterized protein n=1 Tax=Agromyces mariniharenae TaxID=2604423 RepID=A0A5S4V6G8_9MICO|nr:hypothetical protein [Agromyces mariniharenae]TYL53639.1 hypothetical protein FYC51_08280 [Agromyces mariniharenae]